MNVLGCREEDSGTAGFIQLLLINFLNIPQVDPQSCDAVIHIFDILPAPQGFHHDLGDFVKLLFPDQGIVQGRGILPARGLDRKSDV